MFFPLRFFEIGFYVVLGNLKLDMQPRMTMTLNSWSSSCHLLSTEIMGASHYSWLALAFCGTDLCTSAEAKLKTVFLMSVSSSMFTCMYLCVMHVPVGSPVMIKEYHLNISLNCPTHYFLRHSLFTKSGIYLDVSICPASSRDSPVSTPP